MSQNYIDVNNSGDRGCVANTLQPLYVDELSPPPTAVQLTEQLVRRVLKARRLREQQLGADLFADPAWDILLEALATELGQVRSSISGLCYATSVPATTALRWIKKLEQDGWLIRIPDRFDGRRHWMELTPEGSERLRHYFGLVWPYMLPL